MSERPYRVFIRLNQVEFDKLNLLVQQSGLAREAVMRNLILNRRMKIPKPVDYYRLANEVNKIGVNLNQIAHIANTDRRVSPDSIAQCHRLQNELMEIVSKET